MTTTFDAIVIGAGMSGIPLAICLGYKGYKTALIEKAELGGTCLNRGCIPTKTMIASAKIAHQIQNAERWGILADNVRVDLNKVVARKNDLVASIRSGATKNVAKNKNLTLYQGEARFTGFKTLSVQGETLTADKIFINTGTRNMIPAIPGLDAVPFLDSTSALDLTALPEHLLVVGGGYIGVEFAQMFKRFGSNVTLIQRGSQLLVQEDEDISQALEKLLRQEGITVFTNALTQHVESKAKQDVRLTITTAQGQQHLSGSHLMIAAGRTPNTQRLNLEATGVSVDEKGFIKINDKLETKVQGIWALGDVRGGAMFTHTARDDARIVYQNLVKHSDLSIKDRVVPYAVFSDPQLGRVGLTEQQAKTAGYELKIGRYEGEKIAKARALGEAYGLIKIIADAKTDKLLGASVLLAEGAELIHELLTALQVGASYTDVADMVHIHPTLAEGLSSALGGVHRAASDAS